MTVLQQKQLVNQPDEHWFIQAPCYKLLMDGPLDICRTAVLLMGGGLVALAHYPAREEERGSKTPFPIFPLGGYEAWAQSVGFDVESIAIPENAGEIARVLRTVRPMNDGEVHCEEHVEASLQGIALLVVALEAEAARVLS